METQNYAIILAGGTGERMGVGLPKQFLKLAGLTVIEHTLRIFNNHPGIDEILIVGNPAYRSLMEDILQRNSFAKVTKLLNGGPSRTASSRAGVMALPDKDGKVLIHDAVRPFVAGRIIDECLGALDRFPAVDVAIPATDTIIETNDMRCIVQIPPRAFLQRGQTPQGFQIPVIKKAHQMAMKDKSLTVTDDCALILRYGLGQIFVVPGEERNLKITHTEDLFLADKLFQLQSTRIDAGIDLHELKYKVVVVFGASKGIGAATAYMARAYEARVHGFSRSNGVDVRDATAVENALKNVMDSEGRVDHVINTAGILRFGRLADRSPDDIREEIEVNYLGSLNVVRSALPMLMESRGSMALFTSSSFTRGRALYAVYSSSKAAVVNLVQAVAEEMAPQGVRINAINPERTNTPMRHENFGIEPPETLLKAETVAAATIRTLLSPFSGTVIDVRLTDV
jgi:ribitol-5-phosphate 2-dehydrogenase (NADP+) / D-ribitol-5-phosphate cytidylyltransferase